MKVRFLVLALLFMVLLVGCSLSSGSDERATRSGWAIGDDTDKTAVILHTADGRTTWEVQGDKSHWAGLAGADISAVDAKTAWAALGSEAGAGMILHTEDGGTTWRSQSLPQAVPEGVKGIKGVSRLEAWAVGLKGPVLHTADGGKTWTSQQLPVSNVALWKISFVGARR